MKNCILFLIAISATVSSFAQDSLFVCSNQTITYCAPVNTIDSTIFNATFDTLRIVQYGYYGFEDALVNIDSIVFYNPRLPKASISYACTVNELNVPVSDSVLFIDPRTDGFGTNGFETNSNWLWWFALNPSNSSDGVTPVTRRNNELDAPEGDYYLELSGTASSGSVYIGGASYGTRTGVAPDPNSGTAFYGLPADPTEVWFNFYVYGDMDVNTELFVTFHEADEIKSDGSESNDFSIHGIDDGVMLKQCFNHSGWQLFSYRYDQLRFSEYCIPGVEGAGCGNKTYEPHRIKLVSFSLQSEQSDHAVSARIDYPVFTIGGPLDPSALLIE